MGDRLEITTIGRPPPLAARLEKTLPFWREYAPGAHYFVQYFTFSPELEGCCSQGKTLFETLVGDRRQGQPGKPNDCHHAANCGWPDWSIWSSSPYRLYVLLDLAISERDVLAGCSPAASSRFT